MAVGFAIRIVRAGSPNSLGIYIAEDFCILLSVGGTAQIFRYLINQANS